MINKGIAFVCEGETEMAFYRALINYFCANSASLPCGDIESYIIERNDIGEEYICIKTKTQYVTIKFNCLSTISQMTNAHHWVKNECIDELPDITWVVYLCYDTDSYSNDITQFYQGDWDILRKTISSFSENIVIVDLAAKAEIEDIILIDTCGIAKYLKVEAIDMPANGRGKSKMKEVFRTNGKIYHEGYRAGSLINSLNFDYICSHSPITLSHIVDEIFCK